MPKQETLFPSVPGISVNLSSFLSPNFYILHYSLIYPLRLFRNFRLDGRIDYAEPWITRRPIGVGARDR